MPTDVKIEDLADVVRVLPAYLRGNFDKADAELRELYGKSPGVAALVGMCLAMHTPSRIRIEFERAVLDIKRRTLNPNEKGEYDEDCL